MEHSERKGMQLVIPIEDSSSGNSICNHCIDENPETSNAENHPTSPSVERNRVNDGILSAELRDQFESMKSIWRQARRGHNEQGSPSSNESSQTREKRIMLREDLKRKEREVAVETAIKVQNEIATWQNGIADLEALLAAEEEQELNEETVEWEGVPQEEDNGPLGIREIEFVRCINNAPLQIPPQVRFPFLPRAVPTEDEIEEDEDHTTMPTTTPRA